MKTLIHGGPIFTGQDAQLKEGYGVLIDDQLVEAVEPLAQLGSVSEVINVHGRTILPGFVDAHRHIIGLTEFEVTTDLIVSGVLDGVRVASEALEAGITTVRDPGCKHNGIFEMKRAIDSDRIPGPNLYPAGPNPTGAAGPKDWRNLFVCGPWEIRQAVRELKRNGALWIKLVVSVDDRQSRWQRTDWCLSEEEIQAAVSEARLLGLRVSGHVEGLEPARAVVAAGFSAIEHGTVVDESLAETMAQRGVFYVPTLWGFGSASDQWEMPLQPEEREAFANRVAEHRRSFQRALHAGVPIAVGTDAYRLPPPDCFVQELELFIQNGMTNFQALKAATANGAALLGEGDKFGFLAPGMRADLIAVRGNPLDDIRACTRVDFVMKKGKKYVSKIVG